MVPRPVGNALLPELEEDRLSDLDLDMLPELEEKTSCFCRYRCCGATAAAALDLPLPLPWSCRCRRTREYSCRSL